MPNRKRKVQLGFFVTEEEREIIEENIKKTKAGNFSNYIRQVALRGSVLQVDVEVLKQLHHDLATINRDLHQIVYRAAMINDLHEQDYLDILDDYTKIRSAINEKVFRRLHKAEKAVFAPSSPLARGLTNGNH